MSTDTDKASQRAKLLKGIAEGIATIPGPQQSAYSLILFALTWGLQPKLVYEVGVSVGQSTCAILAALHGLHCVAPQGQRFKGRLVSCDVQPACADVVVDPVLRQYWTFHHLKSIDFIAKLKDPARMIYLDGSHLFHLIGMEVENFWPLLEEGGLMVLHDTRQEPKGPGRVLQMVRARGVEAAELPFAHGFGLIHKRAGDPDTLGLC